MVQIKSTKDSKMDGVKVLVYGASGVGKTVLCSTAPTPTIIISTERGLLSIADKDIPCIEINSIEDLNQAYTLVKKGDWETVCLDSISDIAEIVLAEFKGLTKDGRQAYGLLNDEIGNQIRKFRDLPGKNIVFTAKEARDDDAKYSRPMMPGKTLVTQLPYYFDLVLYMRSMKGKRVLHTQDSFTHNAKDRSGKLDEKMDANLTVIIERISNGIN